MVKVLIAEDEWIIAEFLEEILIDAGFEVCGIASTVAEALELGERHRPDLGVIDLFLANGGHGTELAAALRRHGQFGVLYATGNPTHPLLGLAEGEGCITKPYSASAVVAALRIVDERLSNRSTSILPKGFKLLASSSPMPHSAGDYEGVVNKSARPRQDNGTDSTLCIRQAHTRNIPNHVHLEPLGRLSKALLAKAT